MRCGRAHRLPAVQLLTGVRPPRRAYSRQWLAFVAWCKARQLEALPASPVTVALYASDLADQGKKVATIGQAMVAISSAHGAAGHPSPRADPNLLKVLVLRGIRRTLGVAQKEAAPALAGHLRRMVSALPTSIAGLRDRALLLVGFAGAFRRSELVGLELRDVRFSTEGLEVTLRRSKTDQEGRGRLVALPYSGTPEVCPVRALRAWLEVSAIDAGAVFREVTRHGKVGTKALTGRSLESVFTSGTPPCTTHFCYAAAMRIFRVILPSSNIERDVAYFMQVFGDAGRRVSPGRHYFDVGELILAIVDPKADGDEHQPRPNADHIYFSVTDLEAVHLRVRAAGGLTVDDAIATRPWGERSFYAKDPFGNPLCFVDERTVFTGR